MQTIKNNNESNNRKQLIELFDDVAKQEIEMNAYKMFPIKRCEISKLFNI